MTIETEIDVTEAQVRTYNLLSEHTGEDGVTHALTERKDMDATTPEPGQWRLTFGGSWAFIDVDGYTDEDVLVEYFGVDQYDLDTHWESNYKGGVRARRGA